MGFGRLWGGASGGTSRVNARSPQDLKLGLDVAVGYFVQVVPGRKVTTDKGIKVTGSVPKQIHVTSLDEDLSEGDWGSLSIRPVGVNLRGFLLSAKANGVVNGGVQMQNEIGMKPRA